MFQQTPVSAKIRSIKKKKNVCTHPHEKTRKLLLNLTYSQDVDYYQQEIIMLFKCRTP